ncbi:MAG: alpha/beta hydrolase, partial [Chloroflexota bacterium]
MVIIAIIVVIVIALAFLGRSTVEELKIAENVKQSTDTFDPGMTRLEFNSVKPGIKIVGNIYIPDDYKAGERRSAIVVAPPATSVKEQSSHNYAERMQKLGYVALTFDPRGIGETEGIEGNANPSMVANDISSAVTYVRSLPQVDPEKIANLGICAQAASSASLSLAASYQTACARHCCARALETPLPETKKPLAAGPVSITS